MKDTEETVNIEDTTCDWTYKYGGAHPNAVTEAGPRTFAYDLNGNMTEMKNSEASLTRTLTWNDENRLTKTVNTSSTGSTGNSIKTKYI